MSSIAGPTPPSSTSSQNGASPDGQQFRVVRKRNRVPLSCGPCRHRKLKCNRAHPCDNCTKRGDTTNCSYASPTNRKRGSAQASSQSPDDMQNRIDRLEGLVLSLMTAGGQPGAVNAAQTAISSSRSNSLGTGSELHTVPENAEMGQDDFPLNGSDESEVEQVSRGIGIMKVDNGRSIFASTDHWYAILGEIGEVKKYFESHKEEYKQNLARVQAEKADESPGTAFLLHGRAAKDKNELLAGFPSKADSDRLIARYFNAYDPSVPIIHGPSFQKQYDAHWANADSSSIVWLGLCYAMMTLALQSYHRAGDEPPEYQGKALQLSHKFRHLTAQCLILADITQPIQQILETLILHVQSEYGRSKDAEPGVLLMTSLCVRLAMRMGYHRDPGPYVSISPFQGEMRRRVWTFVRQCDLLVSFQFGLPSMVRTEHIDTMAPRNVYDDELYEDMKELPHSRPNFEATPMSYMIAKSKMTFAFGQIVERVSSLTNPPSYEDTMNFDRELREIRSTHPPHLQMRPFQESARDPANLIMQRLGLELVYLRSLFVLHRRFIAQGRNNPRYAYSRRTCIDASMEMLGHQSMMHSESQPGGRLRSVKWYISSLTTHDFLLAAMLVCLDLYHQVEAEVKANNKDGSPQSPMVSDGYADEDRRQQMFQAVEHCTSIWDSVREQSMEAYKASTALKVMIEKLRAHEIHRQQSSGHPSQGGANQPYFISHNHGRSTAMGMFPNGHISDMTADDLPPEQSAAMTLGMLSSGGMSPGPNFGAMGSTPSSAAEKQSYPAGMVGLLNDPQPERTGLTPGYSGPDVGGQGANGLNGAASPFTQMFGQAGAGSFPGLEGLGADIDWGAWDSYIQGSTNSGLDPTQMMPMNMDFGALETGPPPQQHSPSQQQQQQQQQNHGGQSGTTAGQGNLFMGGMAAPGGL
ncbi:hypothetical protein K431DRAFT_12929 [Polychaeton citri CBS 116435]|uniref:Zn(2)-C6 fungal-type domain-containing protein n=1 Tax=Polychaeton citri CBS 116435 TaxID=1314669 RepID=A0A9P4PYV9_9PEZI|nr:hypothetical protein K431DRAFT_12929 [Polychaeton citri CBS 116435]